MIFVVAILARRLSGATFPAQSRSWRIIKGVGLALAFLLTLGGTELALLPLLILLFYGLWRGAYVIKLGQGSKRFLLGGVAMLFTLFAVANYLASLSNYSGVASRESSAVGGVRTIATAEASFRADSRLDVNKNGVPEYGSLEQLHQAGLLEDRHVAPSPGSPYRYTVVLAGDPARDEKEFFVYATPSHYGRESAAWSGVPGASLARGLRPAPPFATRTFASDETGVIRQADLGGSRAVTREEARKWPPLQ
ncbi:MAG: hypothetical protein A3D93_03645 [Acidobacteria bacterium RIFCSPHIGHO2_12_FULL_67_30]|nr:MAG: hypothetical protein A3D93_03645 [Acidobacteria bacterium RIFCSPHIGHO2_12_FULL_67_30]